MTKCFEGNPHLGLLEQFFVFTGLIRGSVALALY